MFFSEMSNPKVSKLTSILRTRSYEYQHLLGRLEPVVDRKKFWAQPQDLLPAASPLSIFQKLDDHLCMFFLSGARSGSLCNLCFFQISRMERYWFSKETKQARWSFLHVAVLLSHGKIFGKSTLQLQKFDGKKSSREELQPCFFWRYCHHHKLM